jgi:hypothetical protein
MSLTKLSLAGEGKMDNLFLQCSLSRWCCLVYWYLRVKQCHRKTKTTNGGFIKVILRGVRCTKSLRVLFLHRRPPSWTTLVLYSRAVFIFNEPTLTVHYLIVHGDSGGHARHGSLAGNNVVVGGGGHIVRTATQLSYCISTDNGKQNVQVGKCQGPFVGTGSSPPSPSANTCRMITSPLFFLLPCVTERHLPILAEGGRGKLDPNTTIGHAFLFLEKLFKNEFLFLSL